MAARIRRLRLATLVSLAVLVAFAVWAYPQLPERIPTHFDIRGEPDAWSRRSLLSWFLLPAVAVFTTALLQFVAGLVARRPEYINMPSRARLLELPRHEQLPILRELQVFVLLMNLLVVAVFGAIEWGTWQAARGQPSRGVLSAVLFLCAVALPALGIVVLVRSTSAVNAAYRRATLRGEIPPKEARTR